MPWKYYFLLMLPSAANAVLAQTDSLSHLHEENFEQTLEDFYQNLEEEEDGFDYNTIFENLESYREKPLNINKASAGELEDLGILSELQINSLLEYRNRVGNLISIYELQAVPDLDLATIRRLVPFVRAGGHLDDYNMSPWHMFRKGKNDLMMRWSRTLELSKGFSPLEEGESASRYVGDENSYYLKFRRSFENRLSVGFSAEKDRGEEFFTGSNRQGFDFYSFHAFLKNQSKTLQAIALGDFSASFGQGLILFSGFGAGKSSMVTSIKRRGTPLRQYTSVNESDFFRGGGVTLALPGRIELTAFASHRRLDANVLEADTLDPFSEAGRFSSFIISGLHRTPSEIADKNSIGAYTGGASIAYSRNIFRLSANAVYDRLDKKLQRSDELYNRYLFNGDRLFNSSLEYSLNFRNVHFFGETAYSGNGSIATLNGALLGLGKYTTMALLYRHFEKDFHTLHGRPFAEASGGQNETGIYAGLELQPLRGWVLAGYFDMWKHPWLRFNVDAPSFGHEYMVRLSRTIRKKMEAYMQFRKEIKERNAPDNETKTDYLVPVERTQFRVHLSYKVSKTLELRNRIDISWYDDQVTPPGKGVSIMQDIIYKPLDFPLSFTARYALFDTPDYNSRVYAFENDVLHAFSIPAYYGGGSRFYINLRYLATRFMTIEARFARTFREGQDGIGSALDVIEGNFKTDFRLQVRLRW